MCNSQSIIWDFKNGVFESNNGTWLDELSEMRGRILYENGKRPNFKLENGKFYDRDGLDEYCYHIIARVNNNIAGCIRILPLQHSSECVTEKIIGKKQFKNIITRSSFPREKIAEVSRWVVDPDYKIYKLGVSLAAAVWATMLKLKSCFIAVAGRYADYLLKRIGATRINGFEDAIYSLHYRDYINVIKFNINNPPFNLYELIHKMSNILSLYSYKLDLHSNFYYDYVQAA